MTASNKLTENQARAFCKQRCKIHYELKYGKLPVGFDISKTDYCRVCDDWKIFVGSDKDE